MTEAPYRRISTSGPVNAAISVPPSKSYTNRALIAAALAEGDSVISNPSDSDDSLILEKALRCYGVEIVRTGNQVRICGTGGRLEAPGTPIRTGNAGTAFRFITSLAALASGSSHITGDDQMKRRPVGLLVDALQSAGVECSSDEGFPPVTVRGEGFKGGLIKIRSDVSSQFISSILLISPFAREPVTLRLLGEPRSLPYIGMTVDVMQSFGAHVTSPSVLRYDVDNHRRYRGTPYVIEADASSASYFFAAAAITRGRVTISNLSLQSRQGDVRFVEILRGMGCRVADINSNIEVHGGPLRGITVDMRNMPDCVPTLAVVAAFAHGPTTMTGIGHLRHKETDRLEAIRRELTNIGCRVMIEKEHLFIEPRPLHGAIINSDNDHRIAMTFAVAGLAVEGVAIRDPDCVSKSYPDFWKDFSRLEGGIG